MSKHRLSRSNTLVVSGPASIILISGRASVLGAPLTHGFRAIVRRGRTLPIYAEEDSEIEVVLGEGGEVQYIEGSTLPQDWLVAADSIANEGKPCVVVVIGDVDSGKTAFTTLLSNYLVSKGCKVAVVDGDVGQSDIGPPTTVGVAMLTKPVIDLFSTEPMEMEFIGNTNPYANSEQIATAIASLTQRALEKGADHVVVNTDGWVQGEEAKRYKLSIIEKTSPKYVAALGEGDSVQQIVESCSDKTICLSLSPAPSVVKKRERDVRKQLREQGYRRYLKDASTRSIPMGWVALTNCEIMSGKPLSSPDLLRKVEDMLGVRVVYAEENPDSIVVVTKHPPKEQIESLEGKRLKVVWEGEGEGLIVGLYGKSGFLGIGVLEAIDFQKRVLKIYTPVKESVHKVVVGCVKLGKDAKEICSLPSPPI